MTIYDVAGRAGVSITTVSNALNHPSRVGAKTLQRVLDVIDELGFTPKAAAVSQARKGVGRIGVIAPFTSYESYLTRLTGVLTACAGRSVEVVTFDHESAAASVSPLLGSLPATGRLDGLLVMGVPLQDDMADRLAARGLPTVLVDSHHRRLPSVNIDDHRGGHLAGEYLASRDHRTFAFVSEPQASMDFLSQGQQRLAGFREALAEAGIDGGAVREVLTSHDVAGGRKAVQQMREWDRLPDAVFAHSDAIAAGVLAELHDAGLDVPDDVAVLGYDDGPLAEALEITTVHQPLAETGRAGAQLLLDTIARPDAGARQLLLPAEIVVRTTA
ncbi:LacI family DNA-binding transcriptional regulator [Angustibacter speluncae]